MAKRWSKPKDPEDVADYGIEWVGTADSPGLAFGTTVVSATWSVVSGGVAVDQDSVLDGTATVARLSGGFADETCELNCHVVCADGQEFDQSIKLKIKER